MKLIFKTLGLCLRAVPALLAGLAAAGCGQFAHVPPGSSVELALARQPEVVRIADQPLTAGVDHPQPVEAAAPAVEPELPEMDMDDVPTNGLVIEDVAAYVARGDALMQEGNTAEAIKAYREAVRVDPTFSVTWRNLAVAYEAAGDEAKAMDAFRHYKRYAAQ